MNYFDDLRTEFTQLLTRGISIGSMQRHMQTGLQTVSVNSLARQALYHPRGGHETNDMQLCKIKNGKAVPEANILEAITLTEDGFHSFAVRVYLERASNIYPKEPFTYPISFLPKDRSCVVELGGRSFEIDLADDARLPGYQTLLDGIRQWLSLEPLEFESQEAKIGFVEF